MIRIFVGNNKNEVTEALLSEVSNAGGDVRSNICDDLESQLDKLSITKMDKVLYEVQSFNVNKYNGIRSNMIDVSSELLDILSLLCQDVGTIVVEDIDKNLNSNEIEILADVLENLDDTFANIYMSARSKKVLSIMNSVDFIVSGKAIIEIENTAAHLYATAGA